MSGTALRTEQVVVTGVLELELGGVGVMPAHHEVALNLVRGSPAFSGTDRIASPAMALHATPPASTVPAQKAWTALLLPSALWQQLGAVV